MAVPGIAGKVLALAGGTGGAKLALGLARVLPPENLVIVVNTGDDECFHGLHVSPDVDTIMYTLSGIVNPETGWGIAGDTFNSLEMLLRYGTDTWFNLGDRDLATHVRRTQLLRQGATLSEVTGELCRRLGVKHQVVPMSDAPVRTVLSTDAGELPMQQYFVQQRSEPKINKVLYKGADSARPAPGFNAALKHAGMVVFCPSNPFLSVGPILAVPGVRKQLEQFNPSRLRVAVSPIVGGAAVRGPAAKIMAELGHEVSCVGVARQYRGLCDIFLIDFQDAHLAPAIEELGMRPVAAPIIMQTEADKIALAELILGLRGS
jgi:LPPG:FO 2-phospho-L-lactate transferase